MADSGEKSRGTAFLSSHLLSFAKNPRIQELLTSRSSPTDLEAIQIQSFISAAPTEINRYDEEIGRLKSALDQATGERSVILSSYDVCRHVVSPVHKLSSEILAKIFHLSAPFEEHLAEMQRLARYPLLQLSKVCSLWHSVALHTPALWSTIPVDQFNWPNSDPGLEKLIGLLKTAVERGGGSALTLDVRLRNRPSDQALDIIIGCSERWYRVDFDGYLQPLMDTLASIQHGFPRLQSLTFSGRYSPGQLTAFETAPQLKEFSCAGPVGSICKLPLKQLQVVVSRANTISTMADTMSIMPHLPKTSRFQIQCNIQHVSPFLPLTYTLPPISANIATLFIQLIPGLSPDLNHQVLDTILGCLTLPFVHGLQFTSGRYPHRRLAWPHATFLGLSSRSSFKGHLRCLDIGDVVIARDELI
ncbi:hypothetical protein B0H16DRAFT_1842781 [Mycena metata]|uniref:F-box domain-containing protein n=1 Tax=Mycena metata TaxID=1033252 RepID=A0AAD7IUC0_9AGAR|nr:hypothetical protein B0H16DRAFT_1842781 [Mycena metata]